MGVSVSYWGYLLRPLATLVFFFIVWLIGRGVTALIPEGRVKEFLTRPHNVIPQTKADRKDWWPVILPWGLFALMVWSFSRNH